VIREAPPNPELYIPNDWPAHGTFHGERIDLRTEAPLLMPADLADVIVDVPGIGLARPWKGSDYAIADNGDIVL
jgi:hypothetical protein